MPQNHTRSSVHPHVVVVGGGFGGLQAARRLSKQDVDVTLVDRSGLHVFTPLLYQVAAGILTPSTISVPLQDALRAPRTRVVRDTVIRLSPETQRVRLAKEGSFTYDYLVYAPGSRARLPPHCGPGVFVLKSLNDATRIAKQLEDNQALARRAKALEAKRLRTVVVVGGGGTGVELAGALAERPDKPRVVLLENGPRLCQSFAEPLSHAAKKHLEALHVLVCCDAKVQTVSATEVQTKSHTYTAGMVVAATGVDAASIDGVPADPGGLAIDETCRSRLSPRIFAIGDAAARTPALPRLAPAALQMASCAAANIGASIDGRALVPWAYFDAGEMAALGTTRALLQSGWLRLHGRLVFACWAVVHLANLPTWSMCSHVTRAWLSYYLKHYLPRGTCPQFGRPNAADEAIAARGALALGCGLAVANVCVIAATIHVPQPAWFKLYQLGFAAIECGAATHGRWLGNMNVSLQSLIGAGVGTALSTLRHVGMRMVTG